MTEIISGVGMFTGVVLALVVLILVARSKLVASGDVQILINDDQSKALSVPAGSKLLNVLIAHIDAFHQSMATNYSSI